MPKSIFTDTDLERVAPHLTVMRCTCHENGVQAYSFLARSPAEPGEEHLPGPHNDILPPSGLPRQRPHRPGQQQKDERFIGTAYHKTFTATKGTAFDRLRTATATVTLVVTVLAHGCPPQAIGAGRASRRHASRVGTGKRRRLVPLPGAGPGSWGACVFWRWPRVPSAVVARSGSSPPCPRSRSSRASCVIASWPPSRLLLPLPVLAQTRSIGLPKPTMLRVVS
jgi:hypothetical protein